MVRRFAGRCLVNPSERLADVQQNKFAFSQGAGAGITRRVGGNDEC